MFIKQRVGDVWGSVYLWRTARIDTVQTQGAVGGSLELCPHVTCGFCRITNKGKLVHWYYGVLAEDATNSLKKT